MTKNIVIAMSKLNNRIYTGCGKKSSPLMVFANFSAVVPEFKVKFGTLV